MILTYFILCNFALLFEGLKKSEGKKMPLSFAVQTDKLEMLRPENIWSLWLK